ncbi:type IV pilus assembly protein PilM [Patescibacteria group bacterium]|nr:type IV pilus assembly protein PilM [Patescibacteria group bacterium]
MGLFSKNESYLGVDIGTASIKACELENARGKASLVTYGMATVPNDLIRNKSPEVIRQITEAIKVIVEQAGIQTRRVVAALPGYAVFTFEIELPKMSTDDLGSAIKFEAKKYIPVPMDEMVVDWEIIEELVIKGESQKEGNKRKAGSYYRILLTAAPRNLVTRYSQIFEDAGLTLDSLETEAMALIRALVGEDKAPILILDMGATATDICLVDEGFPRLSKGVDIGGNVITQAIAESLHIDTAKAEQYKKDQGILFDPGKGSVSDAVDSVMKKYITEIQKLMSMFSDKRGRKVEKVILTGGSARLLGLGEYLEKMLGIKVYAGNPWARVVTPAKVHDSVKRIGPEFSVAIGLAMRNIY